MSAAAVSKRHSPDPASEDSVDARTTRPHRKPLAAQSPRQRPERSCLAPRTAQHRAPQGLKWLSFTPDSGLNKGTDPCDARSFPTFHFLCEKWQDCQEALPRTLRDRPGESPGVTDTSLKTTLISGACPRTARDESTSQNRG